MNISENLSSSKAPSSESLIDFPCHFPIKVIGKGLHDFESVVVDIASKHATLSPDLVKTRPSRNGNYLAVTVTVYVHTKSQIDTIYQELTECERVLWAL